MQLNSSDRRILFTWAVIFTLGGIGLLLQWLTGE